MAISDEDRDAAIRALSAAISQHTSYGYRAASAQLAELNAEVDALSRKLGLELGDMLEGLSPAELQAFAQGKYTTSRLKALQAAIEGWVVALGGTIAASWAASVPAFAAHEVSFAASLLREVAEIPLVPKSLPNGYKAAMDQPMLGKLVDEALAKVSADTKDRVYSTVRAGIAEGKSNVEVVRALRGTEQLDFTDGILQITKNEIERVVRTGRNHVSNVSYNTAWQAMGVEEVMDLATLDGRTSKFCASIDGRRHKVSEPHPKPPYHYHCRTVQVPYFDDGPVGTRPYVRALKVVGRDGDKTFRSVGDMTKRQRERAGLEVGQVQATTKYADWFADQDAAFQREWLGPKRYELYKKGGYTLDRFADPRGGQYTLEQLRAKDAQTFREVFGATSR